jgi:hypothetical protein
MSPVYNESVTARLADVMLLLSGIYHQPLLIAPGTLVNPALYDLCRFFRAGNCFISLFQWTFHTLLDQSSAPYFGSGIRRGVKPA